ncbi:MAG: tRNA (adenosine(37)-N6)-dimethylallyltransferase MiaA [Candidatus Margulisiibacteriota bacterium]
MINILGPTAVGKSKIAVELAKIIQGEIISADSMQVYRGMGIGTAKPTLKERQSIPHHLMDIKNPDEEWTVSDFVEQTNKLANEITKRGKVTIIAGGTGLYLWALLEGFSFPMAPADKELRKRLEKIPLSALYARLSTIDPQAAEKIHSNDKKRIIRALEVYELTGEPISKMQKVESGKQKIEGRILIGLTLPREELYRRIEERVDKMIEKGLIEEVKGLLAKGYSKDLPSFQALGYKEAVEYLDGKWTKEQMITELKKRTRHFARRQMTWFKRFKNVRWFEAPVDTQAILDYIKSRP